VKISWQITAVRQDAFAKAHPLIVEQAKPARERGFYRNPELFGQPAERQTEWGRRPQQMERMKVTRERQKVAARQRFMHSHDQPARAVNKEQPSLAVAACGAPKTNPGWGLGLGGTTLRASVSYPLLRLTG